MREFFTQPNIDFFAVLGILIFFGLVETLAGHYQHTRRDKDDWILEIVGFFVVIIAKTVVFSAVFYLFKFLMPTANSSLGSWPFLASCLFYLLIDDFLQYWYHRTAHEYQWLWKHHKSHHDAEEMGILVSYRNSLTYYLLMPNIWWAGICTFLGLAPAVVFGLVFKQIIVTASHSTWPWDRSLYQSKWLRPLASLIERIFITPAFHHGHHGKSKADGISDPNGNFGNTFSLWDQLFGTATFARAFPHSYGMQVNTNDSWSSQLFYPFVKAQNPKSELSGDHIRVQQTVNEPFKSVLPKGTYLYCQCGFSSEQPFCNGAHHGSKHKPLLLHVASDKVVSLCQCKRTRTPPYCDNSHLS